MSEQNNQDTVANPRVVVGRVVSNKMDKTITVLIERRERHPLYGKYVRRSSKLKAHDEDNRCREGDLVSITQCRPMARSKHYRLVDVIEQATIIESGAEA